MSEIRVKHDVDVKDLFVKVTMDGVVSGEWHTTTNTFWNEMCIEIAALANKLLVLHWGVVGFDEDLKVEIKSGDAGWMRAGVTYQTIA